MSKKSLEISPETEEILAKMGEQIKLARLRRRIPAEMLAYKAGISRTTLWSVEKGSPSVAIGIYAAVLHVMDNMDQDFLNVAKDDEMGRRFQNKNLLLTRAPRARNI